jgi:hypothetical protein
LQRGIGLIQQAAALTLASVRCSDGGELSVVGQRVWPRSLEVEWARASALTYECEGFSDSL